MSIFMRCVVLVLVLGGAVCWGASGESSWGVQGSGGIVYLPESFFSAVQDDYTASANGPTFTGGIVRFNPSDSPSFSIEYFRAKLEGDARGKGEHWEGDATFQGVLVTKYVNLLTRKAGSFGFAFGGGVGPKFTAHYSGTGSGISTSTRTYKLDELPVTPLFLIGLQGDIRAGRYASFGPSFGVTPMGLRAAVTFRVRFK